MANFKPLIRLFLSAGVLLMATTNALAQTPTELRRATTTVNGITETSEYTEPTEASRATPFKNRVIQNHTHGLWIFDVLINLTTDYDADGYYSTFNITLDVETNFTPRTVYAVLYFSHNHSSHYYGPWQEYAVTGNFTVSGTGSRDAVVIDIDLDSGYPTGYYDHLVEIYDANSGELLIVYGPDNSHHVRGIPFESYNNDAYFEPINVQFSISGSGSLSIVTLTFISTLLVVGYRRRRHTIQTG